jgi:hypothetical protein
MSIFAGPKIVEEGLVLYLDAANQKSYPGSGTTWFDLSGNLNNGTLTNGPVYSTLNKGNFIFDGVNDKISTSYGPQLNDFTVIAWFKSNSGGSYNRVVDKDYASGMWIGRQSNISNSWGGGVREGSSPYGRYITLADNQWHMIVSKREGTTHTIYGDGVTNFISGTVSASSLSTTTFAFGTWSSNLNERFTGNISQILIYNRALTNTEINKNFEATRGRYGI